MNYMFEINWNNLKTSYNQIYVVEDVTLKFYISYVYNHSEFLVMPFNLIYDMFVFQLEMNYMFRDWLKESIVIFLIDILIYNVPNLQKHACYIFLSNIFAFFISCSQATNILECWRVL
jgi:hypothetical protein